jgi:AcrR family transcriptional regulator
LAVAPGSWYERGGQGGDGKALTAAGGPRRAYSPRRAEQARRPGEIIAAAHAEFVRSGYAGATIAAIAAAAAVSVPTVELVFGTKRELLKAAADVAMAGDDAPISVSERDWVRQAQATCHVEQFLEAVAGGGVRPISERAAGVLPVIYQAAAADEQIAVLARQFDQQRLTLARAIVDALARRARLRADISRAAAADIMWLLMDPVVYQRLTVGRGWAPGYYQRWFIQTTRRLLLADPQAP